jgi:hypothetical protein
MKRSHDRGIVMTSVSPPSAESVLDVHRDGIAAIVEITNGFEDADWLNPSPCDGWAAQDVATHLVTVTMMWHQALDDSEGRHHQGALVLRVDASR